MDISAVAAEMGLLVGETLNVVLGADQTEGEFLGEELLVLGLEVEDELLDALVGDYFSSEESVVICEGCLELL